MPFSEPTTMPDAPARTPAIAQVSEKMRRTLMPMPSAVIWSDEVARIAMPRARSGSSQ